MNLCYNFKSSLCFKDIGGSLGVVFFFIVFRYVSVSNRYEGFGYVVFFWKNFYFFWLFLKVGFGLERYRVYCLKVF